MNIYFNWRIREHNRPSAKKIFISLQEETKCLLRKPLRRSRKLSAITWKCPVATVAAADLEAAQVGHPARLLTRLGPSLCKKNISTIYYFHSLLVVFLNDAKLRNLIQSCTFSVFITVQYSVPITHLAIQWEFIQFYVLFCKNIVFDQVS